MEMFSNPPEISSEERTTRDVVKRIRKLRWIGMLEEAKRLQAALYGKRLTESVFLLPADTD